MIHNIHTNIIYVRKYKCQKRVHYTFLIKQMSISDIVNWFSYIHFDVCNTVVILNIRYNFCCTNIFFLPVNLVFNNI